MAKSNLQVRVPDHLLTTIEKIAGTTKSTFVREAIEEKIRRERDKIMELEWIKALGKHPEDLKESNAWLAAEKWENK